MLITTDVKSEQCWRNDFHFKFFFFILFSYFGPVLQFSAQEKL